MRPKPPVGVPPLNRGLPWSADDLADLEQLRRERAPISHIAEYLRRDVEEVRAKLAALEPSR